MRKLVTSLILAAALVAPSLVSAQAVTSPASITKTISTNGSDCSVATNCAVFGMTGSGSLGVDIQIAGTATIQFEGTSFDANNATQRWRSITDDVNAGSSGSASGFYFFTNSGYSRIRFRASAISGGNVTVTAVQGNSGLRTTASVTVSGANNTLADGVTPSIKATVKNFTNSNPLATMIVDASGNQITSFGGGTQYANGAVQATPTGTVALGWDSTNVRALSTDSSGRLNINGGGTADNSAFTQGTTSDTVVAGLYATSWSNPTAGHSSVFREDINGGIYANLDKVGTTAITLGAKAAASSFPVTLSTDVIGSAGSAAASVISVQGIASMTALKVDNSAVNQPVIGIKTNNNAAPGANNEGVLPCLANTSAPSFSDGLMTTCSTDVHGATRMLQMDSTGAVVPLSDGGSGATTANTTRVTPASDGVFFTKELPSTPVIENALSTTVQTVNGSASILTAYYCANTDASNNAYVQIFDISGTVTLGVSTPKWSIMIPKGAAANLGGFAFTFANAIKVAATTTATGSSAPSTALDCNFAYR